MPPERQFASSPQNQEHDGVLLTAVLAYAALLAGGFFLFQTKLAMRIGSEASMSMERAVMTVTNAATLTGFQSTLAVESFRMPAQITLLVLTIGGALCSWIAGGVLVARALQLSIRDSQIVIASVAMIALALVGGIATAPPNDLFASLFRSVSAVTNSGLWIGASPSPRDATTLCWWLPLAVLGGIGSSVLVELFRWPAARTISRHALTVLALTAAAFLVGLLLIGWGEWMSGRLNELRDIPDRFVLASAQSINARTAGLPLAPLDGVSRATQWMLVPLMVVGGAPGGAAGGIHLTTIFVIAVGVAQLFRGEAAGRVFAVAVLWALTFAAVVFGTFVQLLIEATTLSPDRLFFLAVSATANVGFSHDPLTANEGAYVLSAAMIAGRVLPLVALWMICSGDDRADVAI